MHLMVLGASRHHGRYPGVQLVGSQCTWWCWALPDSGLRQESRPDSWSQCTWWCWVLPDPWRVVRCPAWGNGARVATGLRALLGPGRASLIEPGFAQFSQGSPPMGLQGVRAARSQCGHADPGGRAVFFGYQCAGAGHESASPCPPTVGRRAGGGGRRPRAGRPRCSPVQ